MTEPANDIEFYSDRSQFSTMESRNSIECQYQRELNQLPDWKVNRDNGQSTDYNNVRQELYDSEQAYLKYLVAIQKLFVNPLARMTRLIKKTDLRTLFGEITSIYNVNKELLYELRVAPSVDRAFWQITPFLKFYTTYARNYSNSQKVFNKLMLRGDFREFIEEQELDPACQGIKFSALMIMPVQRVPRYILLIKRLHEESNKAEERSELKGVLEQMSEITGLIEACIRDFENGEKLWLIQESLGLKEDIVAPGRRLIKEGTLYKRSHCGEATYNERSFWLFNDILVYGKRRMGMGPRYECSCIFPLRHCTLEYNEYDGSLFIRCKTHSVLVTSESYDDLKAWFEEMTTAVERNKMLRSTLRKESSRQQVKEFKSQIKKKFTKKFINKTYLYDMASTRSSRKSTNKKRWEEAASCSVDVNVMISPPAMEQSKRKRKAETEFDVELRTALQRRRMTDDGASGSNETIEESPIKRSGPRDTARAALTTIQVDVHTNYNKDVDETDRAPRTRSKIREEVKRRSTQQTLSHPEIRKYSYQEPSAPQLSESSTADSSFADLPYESTLAVKNIPWWVSESTPAMFAKRKETRGFMDTVRSCTIM